jgi:hypothetical protein
MRPGWRRTPASSRFSADDVRWDDVVARHSASLDAGLPTYIDPVSGFSVFTSDFLAARRYCCDSGCRHCPYVD